jgi:diguanylate cyclase (GGDEF)-like protein
MRRSALRLLWLAFLAVLTLSAQAPYDLARPALRSHGMEDGLPSGTIYGFTTDASGRLWAGTVDGAAYYTGRGWVPVRMPKESGSQYIRAILASRDGSLWFGTQDGGVWRRQDGQWSHFQAGRELPSNHVFTLAESQDPQGRLVRWVGTGDHGIAALSDGRWRTWGPADGLPGGTVWRIREIQAPDGGRRIWAATEKGLCVLEGDRWRKLGAGDGFPGEDANDVLDVQEADGSRSVWVSMWSRGLARWDGHSWQVFGSGGSFPARNPTTSLGATRDAQGRTTIWVGTLNQGLWWFQDGRWQALNRAQGFLTAGILSTLPGPGGKPTLWVGSRGGGVVSLDLGGWRTLDEAMGLPGMEVMCFAEDGPPADPTLWVGTSSGLVRYRSGKPAERLTAGLPSDYVIALQPMAGELWAATLKGLARLEGGAWRPVDSGGVLPEGMSICLLETRAGDGRRIQWVGTPNGLACRDRGRWRLLTRRDGLAHDYVGSLCAVPGGDGEPVLWAGTRGGGVSRLEHGTWTTFGAEAGLANLTVYALHASTGPGGERWLWAGTLGGGLARLDLRTPGRWQLFRSDTLPGLASNYIQRIEEDRLGRLYLSTSSGVTRIHLDWAGAIPRPVRAEAFTLGDGLPSHNLNLGASFVDGGGRVWVGTSRGATVLDPARETFPPAPPPPVLERVSVADPERPVRPGQRLGHRDAHLRFEFSLPVYHRKEDTRFQTQLLGLEPAPRPWQAEPWREFATLPAGGYRLRVWALAYDGRVSGPIEFPFRVAPPLWLHPAALAGYLLAAAAGVLGILALRTRVLRERTLTLEGAVQDRTRIIEQQSRALEASNRKLEALSATDGLTGLANRRHFDEVLAREHARHARTGAELSLILLDIDQFKRFNDSYGHVSGDDCLRRIARVIGECAARPADLAARYGGEEFACILPETDPAGAALIAERIRQAVLECAIPHRASDVSEWVSASLGVITARCQPQEPVEDLLERVDAQLYRAKAGGRNRVVADQPCG